MGFFGGPKKINVYSPGQNAVLGQLTGALGQQIGRGVDAYGGQLVAGTTPNQRLAFGAAPGLLNQGVDTTGAIQGLLSGAPAYQVDPAARERYYQQSVVAPAQRGFQDTLQQLDHRYGARFGTAGAQREAANRAAVDFNTNLAGQRAKLVWGDEQARRQSLENAANRMGTGLQGAASYDASNIARLGTLAGLGGAERGIQGQQLAGNYYNWQNQQAYNNPWLGYLGTALSASPYAVGQSQGWAGALGGLMGGAGKLAGGLSSLWSSGGSDGSP